MIEWPEKSYETLLLKMVAKNGENSNFTRKFSKHFFEEDLTQKICWPKRIITSSPLKKKLFTLSHCHFFFWRILEENVSLLPCPSFPFQPHFALWNAVQYSEFFPSARRAGKACQNSWKITADSSVESVEFGDLNSEEGYGVTKPLKILFPRVFLEVLKRKEKKFPRNVLTYFPEFSQWSFLLPKWQGKDSLTTWIFCGSGLFRQCSYFRSSLQLQQVSPPFISSNSLPSFLSPKTIFCPCN